MRQLKKAICIILTLCLITGSAQVFAGSASQVEAASKVSLRGKGKVTETGKNGWFYEKYNKKTYKFYYKDGKKVKDIRKLIAKQSRYWIYVNKKKACVTIYAKDPDTKKWIVPVVAFTCSPGHATPVGTFKTPAKYRWKALMGCMGQYSTRIKGGFLFHSVLYRSRNWKTLSSSSYNNLGKVCSHGCVRLQVIDAKWIYDNCKLRTKVTIYKSSKVGPLGKPKLRKIKKSQNWDPTDPKAKKKYK